jgi:hypothetical protein
MLRWEKQKEQKRRDITYATDGLKKSEQAKVYQILNLAVPGLASFSLSLCHNASSLFSRRVLLSFEATHRLTTDSTRKRNSSFIPKLPHRHILLTCDCSLGFLGFSDREAFRTSLSPPGTCTTYLDSNRLC